MPRSSAKSKVSPPTLPAGSSQPASVNCPASQVYAPGSRRCWISAASESGTERWPHSKRSVNRRLAMMTYARACAANATSASTCSSGASSSSSSSTPMASPRLVTGANTRVPSALVLRARPIGWPARARASSPPTAPARRSRHLGARGRAAAGVAEPDERVAAEVRDEERDLAGSSSLARRSPRTSAAENGGASSTADEQLREVEVRRGPVFHRRNLERRPRTADGSRRRKSRPRPRHQRRRLGQGPRVARTPAVSSGSQSALRRRWGKSYPGAPERSPSCAPHRVRLLEIPDEFTDTPPAARRGRAAAGARRHAVPRLREGRRAATPGRTT